MDNRRFAQLVALACHDLRNPLATVYGFGRVLARTHTEEPAARYIAMIDEAAAQLGDLLDELSLVARIQGGRFEPTLEESDSLELARTAAAQLELGDERLVVDGRGATVLVPAEQTSKALARLGKAAARHGGFDEVTLTVHSAELELAPVTPTSAPVLVGEEIRELSVASAVALVEALGGSLRVEGDRLHIRLPAA